MIFDRLSFWVLVSASYYVVIRNQGNNLYSTLLSTKHVCDTQWTLLPLFSLMPSYEYF